MPDVGCSQDLVVETAECSSAYLAPPVTLVHKSTKVMSCRISVSQRLLTLQIA